MDATLILIGLGGALAVAVTLLVVVVIARGLDKADASAGAKTEAKKAKAEPVQLAKVFRTIAERTGHRIPVIGKSADDGDTAMKAAKQVKAVVSVAVTLAVLGSIGGIVAKFTGEEIEPEISEIAAGELHGTMVNARNSDPVVLIVPGSGPTDRDGNNPSGLRSDAYKLLAEGMIEERIASVRIDKRGMFGSAGAGDPNVTSTQPYVDDIRAWIDAIKAERGPDSGCVFLLGHSEGALMVSLAAEGRDDVCGVILVAGMGRRMSDVIREQLEANPANAPVLDQAMAAISELEAGRHPDTTDMHPALLPLFRPAVQDYLISMFATDPVEAVRRAGKHTLILQGTTDLQVSVDDARLLDAAPNTELRLIEGMNHILKEAPTDRAENIATYSDPGLPLAPRLVRRIRDFIRDND